jgi:hypothetical protein
MFVYNIPLIVKSLNITDTADLAGINYAKMRSK